MFIVIPFVTQLVVTIGAIGYLSFRNGQKTIQDTVANLTTEINQNVHRNIQSFLAIPQKINKINSSLIQQGLLDIYNSSTMERYFWEQAQIFKSVSSISFGYSKGGIINAGNEKKGSYIITTGGRNKGAFNKIAVDEKGNRTELLVTVPDFDSRTRPWYIRAAEQAKAIWSDVYIIFTGHDMALTAGTPVYDQQNNLLGVTINDVFLSKISEFLGNLTIAKSGEYFIIERSGLLVASSTKENPFVTANGGKKNRRIYAHESKAPLIQHAATYLRAEFGEYPSIEGEQGGLIFKINEQRHYLKVKSIEDKYGINWLGVVVIPEADFMEQINNNNRITAFLMLLASVLAVAVGIFITRLITTPVLQLTTDALSLSQGEQTEERKNTFIHEISKLQNSFLEMSGKVQQKTNALEAEKERYKEIFNAPSDAIFMHDADTGKIIDVNQGMLDMYGCTYDEALQQDMGSISSGKSPYSQKEAVLKVQDTMLRGPQKFDWLSKKMDGTLFWVEVSLKQTEFGGMRSVIAVVRDVNNRKQAEKNLATEKERLAVTLRSIGDGVITTDIEGKVVFINKIAEDLTGWLTEEAKGKSSTEIFHIINEKTGKKCVSPVQRVIELGRITSLVKHTELIAKDGVTRSIADSGAPIRDNNGKLIGVVLVFRDITHERKIEEELLKVQKLESVGILAGGIAHDFNNILSAVLGNVELASNRIAQEDTDTKTLLSDAKKATRRATKLTSQLLTFAKGGAPVKEEISLPTIITESAKFVLRGSKVDCNYNLPEDLWMVDADSGQIGQVIQNIVINAKHAMPEGGTIQIRCTNVHDAADEALLSTDNSQYVRITIQDTGVGISEKIISKIFDPYYSTKREGSGLGLAICHSIVSKHSGHLTVNSSTGKGATFTLYLPALSATGSDVTTKTKITSSTQASRIIIMDDDKMIRDVAKAQLLTLGHEPIMAEDGEQAINKYQEMQESKTPVDLVIMDLTIPGGMGGQEAAEKLLKIDSNAKIIVASGYSNDPVMASYKEYGFCTTLAKPFDLKELGDAIASVV